MMNQEQNRQAFRQLAAQIERGKDIDHADMSILLDRGLLEDSGDMPLLLFGKKTYTEAADVLLRKPTRLTIKFPSRYCPTGGETAVDAVKMLLGETDRVVKGDLYLVHYWCPSLRLAYEWGSHVATVGIPQNENIIRVEIPPAYEETATFDMKRLPDAKKMVKRIIALYAAASPSPT
jgi:hypothetical protein